MESKKNFNFLAARIMAIVDFLKWVATCDAGNIRQIEHPYSGAVLSPALSDLFALQRDDIGWMLVMRAEEGNWLPELPLHSAYVGYSDGLLLLTDEFELLEQKVPQVALEIFVPQLALTQLLSEQTLLGFGIATPLPEEEEGGMHVARVNKVIPLYTKARYEAQRNSIERKGDKLFQR